MTNPGPGHRRLRPLAGQCTAGVQDRVAAYEAAAEKAVPAARQRGLFP
ncbi:hypothetical protein [Actinomadura sp. DC4]|nr:hypothetical protein [Actinomadura sp. DC4]MDN3351519.1 hypothetical protein [Actinomadura sp. DC4]